MQLAESTGTPTVTSLCCYVLAEALAEQQPDAALASLERARQLAEQLEARLLTGIATTAELTLRGRHGDPALALARYGDALETLDDAGADGLVLTALRNLVVLLVRIGATSTPCASPPASSGSAPATPTGRSRPASTPRSTPPVRA